MTVQNCIINRPEIVVILRALVLTACPVLRFVDNGSYFWTLNRWVWIVILVASLPSGIANADPLSIGLAAVGGFMQPEGPAPTLESMLQDKALIRALHKEMKTLEIGLRTLAAEVDGSYPHLVEGIDREFEQTQRAKVRGAMEDIQTYLNNMAPGDSLDISETDRKNLTELWVSLSNESRANESRALAYRSDLNAPVLIAALGYEVALLHALDRPDDVKAVKAVYRQRLAALFESEQRPAHDPRGQSILYETRRYCREVASPRQKAIEEEIRFSTWNIRGNLESAINVLEFWNCEERLHPVILELRDGLLENPVKSLPQFEEVGYLICPVCQGYDRTLSYVKDIILRLDPTAEERQQITAQWKCPQKEWNRQMSLLKRPIDVMWRRYTELLQERLQQCSQ